MPGTALDDLHMDIGLDQGRYVGMAKVVEPVLDAHLSTDALPGLGEDVGVE